MEEKEKAGKFYLGMDVGTNSVGMACTDENYALLRAKGKDAWCVRLFDEAETAASRRTARTARRRLKRRRYRINLLQELFAPFIHDETFFIRLNNSQFFPEDKDEKLGGDKNALFADSGYADKDFHKEFPTIFHLRKALSGGEKKYDPRLYYLALHHIVKYRGHFLYEGEAANVHDIRALIEKLNAALVAVYGDGAVSFDISDNNLADEAKRLLTDDLTPSDKQKKLAIFFKPAAAEDKKIVKAITSGICGLTVSPKDLLGEEYKEEKSFKFSELDEEKFEGMRATYGDDFELLEAIRAIYSFAIFEKLLAGKDGISDAMIGLYDRHKSDLKRLKAFVKKYLPDKYNEVFKSTGIKKADGKNQQLRRVRRLHEKGRRKEKSREVQGQGIPRLRRENSRRSGKIESRSQSGRRLRLHKTSVRERRVYAEDFTRGQRIIPASGERRRTRKDTFVTTKFLSGSHGRIREESKNAVCVPRAVLRRTARWQRRQSLVGEKSRRQNFAVEL